MTTAAWRRALATTVGLGLVSTGVLLIPRQDAQATTSTAAAGSAVTVAGSGAFSSLRVTVSQTNELTNEVVSVSWTGGAPTVPSFGEFDANFMQVMQCWGDDPSGPSPEQCQFGEQSWGSAPVPAGFYTVGRRVWPSDPLAKNVVSADGSYVPFHGADGNDFPGDSTALSKAFTASNTNEIALARTLSDGTGRLEFEMQTGLESPGLGCGLVPKGGTQPHRCWLVLVPRGSVEIDGTKVRGTSDRDRLNSSPLSPTNWKDRISVPLDFVPIGAQCPIGADERPVSGNQLIAAAVLNWQSGFCQSGGANLSFVSQSDAQARSGLASGNPQLRLLTNVQPSAPSSPGTVYAPVALSGLTFAFLVEQRSNAISAQSAGSHEGRVIESVKLNQRLAAKLLTQSYAHDTWDASAVVGNPNDPSKDPEFLTLNPQFAHLELSIFSPLVQGSGSDAVFQLWQWIVADPDARLFLDGKPDAWGMHLNTHYKGLTLPQDVVPRADTTCVSVLMFYADQLPRCALERAPYASDMESAARFVFRGQLQGHNQWIENDVPHHYGTDPAQPIGARSMSALTDTASAQRFALVTAALRNSSGNYVAPTDASISAAANAMVAGPVAGTLVADVAHQPAAAYPLTTYIYAATRTGHVSATDAETYADFIRFAVTSGQHEGTGAHDLPPGYVPLPPGQIDAAKSAADVIAANKLVDAAPSPTPTPQTRPATGEAGGAGGTSDPPTSAPKTASSDSASPATSPIVPVSSSIGSSGAVAPIAVPQLVSFTPAQPLGAGRFGAIAALILGGLALAVRGGLPWVGRRPPS